MEREHRNNKQAMKKALLAILTTAISLMFITAGCEKYDDSALVARMDKAESDIAQLKTLIEQLNITLSSLATTVDALNDQDRIVSVTEMADKSGWIVEFSKSGKINIYNGKNGIDGTNGTNGTDGATPTIGVKLDADGNYYWTVNGEYLHDENDNKIAATAHVATPQIKIENGYFWFSSNNGATWEKIGEAGNAGSVIISDIKDGDDDVTFTLADGTFIVVPKVQKFAINVQTDVIVSAGQNVNVSYTLTGADDSTTVDAFGTKGFETEIFASSTSAGKVKVTAPNPLTNGKVYIIAVKSDGTTTARILTCEEGVFILDETAFATKVPASGGAFEAPFQTNQDNPMVQVSPGYSWITHVETKAMRNGVVVFNIDENTSEEDRTGYVSINYKEYTIIQSGKSSTPSTGGGRADLETINGGETATNINNTYETTNGWSTTSTRIAKALNGDNPRYDDVGTGVRPVISGRRNDVSGVLSSPILTGGCGTVTIDYSRHTSKTGSNFTVEIKDVSTGSIIKSETHTDETLAQYERNKLNFDFNISGEFQIVVTAYKCSNTSNTTNDDLMIIELAWTGYSE